MYLGIDFGTSGCRAVVIDDARAILAEASQSLPAPQSVNGRTQQTAEVWQQGLDSLFQQLSAQIDIQQIKRLAIDGTSATVLICNQLGKTLTAALMYNDNSSTDAVTTIKQHCPVTQHLTMAASSGLPKALQLIRQLPAQEYLKITTQTDYLSNQLTGKWGVSDYHNALKLGYDVQNMEWPQWLKKLVPQGSLPEVMQPGQVMAHITDQAAEKYGLSTECQVCAGSTDANAAFIATESIRPGDAVTSIGTTIVVKILNDQPVQDLTSGVYSHKLGQYWLASGGSNAGAGILRQFFTDQQIVELSERMAINQPTGLHYYPLQAPGERFPYNDPHKQPVIEPRPDSDVIFLQALLEGLSRIEQAGYDKLHELGAIQPVRVQTCGGGAKNSQWTALRSQLMGIPVKSARQTEACYGSALLALKGLEQYE